MGARVPEAVAPVNLWTDAVACVDPNPPLVCDHAGSGPT
jgi:hypothetical protein